MLTEKDLKSRVGPILSDGTLVRDLIDLERREVSLRVLNDPEIHELELDGSSGGPGTSSAMWLRSRSRATTCSVTSVKTLSSSSATRTARSTSC
jgi:hypothetical protein